MNCEKCQELISDFLDGVLTGDDRARFDAHLEECLSCAGVRDDLGSILSLCREQRDEFVAPPNEQALWLRIRNLIESERDAATAGASASASAAGSKRESLWSRLMNRHVDLSLPQMAAATVAIAVIVSLATVFGVRHWNSTVTTASAADMTAGSQPRQMAATAPRVEDRMSEQQLAIDYWNRRIEERKAAWNRQTREAFEHNLSVIDQAVEDQRQALSINPHDEISEEMLNDALNEKVRLLKEFSDL